MDTMEGAMRTRLVSHTKTLGLAAGILATITASEADAQRWGRPGTPRSGACFYRDANFQGDYFCVRAGEGVESVPDDMNDEISSIRTFGADVEVTVYQNRRFSGRSERFGDVRNLRDRGWNDKLSSVQVESVSRGGRLDRDRDGGFSSNASAERIVRRAYQDILDREPDAAGMRTYRSRIIDDDWSEEQVREALRRSPEYRERTTMTPQKAAEIVRRAYLSVLNREPDAASQGYVQRVLRDKWTEQDVARELRRSPEYRAQRRGR
jgi:hypothetical protein